MKIILCGYHWAGCKALNLLLDKATDIYVYTHIPPPSVPDLIDYCKEKGVSCSVEDISTSALPFKPDIISSVYYRNIISPSVIDACNKKIFNLHPSLLPKYRGCSSLTWAMINGESEAGFTFHYIDRGCDTGNVILQKSFPIEDFDTQLTLFNRAMFYGMSSYLEALDMVACGFPGKRQDGEPSYYKRGCPYNGEIHPEWDQKKVKRFIRAMQHPPLPVATYLGDTVNNYSEYCSLKAKKEG